MAMRTCSYKIASLSECRSFYEVTAVLGVLMTLSLTAGCSNERISSCRELENRYLSLVSDAEQTATFGSPATNEELRLEAVQLEDVELRELELSFLDLSDQCGDRAAMVAHGKATRMVFGE
ncbi:hypothetical protein A3718_11020 [Erythrobacter sp. HI0019]|uniref:hypothetical protein n=1 Tax=unclassified Erythrobacter TaxID=2633097 RepID=UPI0007B7C595|nr:MULTISPECIES: hypothetical protein [unclassified Erythrobacter]KZX92862.1 hypothetical protein A3718_11020 [Erythrobacter sp. HI0019]KZY01024.1 hypothetical protein A3723_06385 [Erythrobacter sp. HI0028]